MTFESTVSRRPTRAQVQMACVAVIGAVVSIVVAPDLRGVLGALLAWVMLAIALTDARLGIIPDEWNAAGLTLAVLNAVLQNPDTMVEAMAAAVLRGGALALLFLGLRVAYRGLRGRDGIGLGDVKLAVVAGAWLSWLTIPIAVELAALAGLATYLVRRYWLGRALQLHSRLPFGLFFAPAIWLGWLLETTSGLASRLGGLLWS
jgi:leader peptidase (prepilin peptidase) / N-methyltransferase